MLTEAILGQLHCEIVLPDDRDAHKSTPQIFDPRDDRRRFPRRPCRVDGILQYQSTYPTLRRSGTFYRIMIRDISRSGVGFLHGEQIFPDENARFIFPNGAERQLTVKRCQRLGPKCFLVGADFDEPLNDLTEGHWR